MGFREKEEEGQALAPLPPPLPLKGSTTIDRPIGPIHPLVKLPPLGILVPPRGRRRPRRRGPFRGGALGAATVGLAGRRGHGGRAAPDAVAALALVDDVDDDDGAQLADGAGVLLRCVLGWGWWGGLWVG